MRMELSKFYSRVYTIEDESSIVSLVASPSSQNVSTVLSPLVYHLLIAPQVYSQARSGCSSTRPHLSPTSSLSWAAPHSSTQGNAGACFNIHLAHQPLVYHYATTTRPFLPACAKLPRHLWSEGRLDEEEVKILVRCGLRMLKSMGSQRFVSRVDAPEYFFAEDVDMLVCQWEGGNVEESVTQSGFPCCLERGV